MTSLNLKSSFLYMAAIDICRVMYVEKSCYRTRFSATRKIDVHKKNEEKFLELKYNSCSERKTPKI
jgi:hypothetical protein